MNGRGKTRIEAAFTHVRRGLRIGALRVPRSAGPHPYGTSPVPIVEIGAGEGPTVLLVAGNHGDEYEGRVILQRLTQRIDVGRILGRLIVLPALNLPAVRAGSRLSPLDDGDMNRSFPVDPESLASP